MGEKRSKRGHLRALPSGAPARERPVEDAREGGEAAGQGLGASADERSGGDVGGEEEAWAWLEGLGKDEAFVVEPGLSRRYQGPRGREEEVRCLRCRLVTDLPECERCGYLLDRRATPRADRMLCLYCGKWEQRTRAECRFCLKPLDETAEARTMRSFGRPNEPDSPEGGEESIDEDD